MDILHISDIHFCISYREPKTDYEKMLHKMQSPQIPLEYCLRRALNQYPADLLVITGDLTDEGTPEDYRRLRELVQENCSLPVLITPGNHDRRENLRQGWECEGASSSSFHSDFRQFGQNEVLSSSALYFDIRETADTAVLSFDSSENGNPNGCIGREQLEWLELETECRREKQVIWMTHHHLDPGQADIPPLPYGEEFLALLRRYPPVCILNGHTHHPARGLIAGIPYYTAPGMAFEGYNTPDGRVQFRETYGYSWYRIQNGVVTRTAAETFAEERVLDTFCW